MSGIANTIIISLILLQLWIKQGKFTLTFPFSLSVEDIMYKGVKVH